jgi:hypothetical protein
VNARQRIAFAHPMCSQDEIDANPAPFRRATQLNGAVLISTLTLNR